MIKVYNHDKTLIESTSETPFYLRLGRGGGGGGEKSYPSVHFVHVTILAHWIQLSQFYHQPN